MVDQPHVIGVPPRVATTDEWAASTLILGVGESGLDTDTGVEKRGDGATLWAGLPAVGGSAAPFISHYEASWIHTDFADAPDVITTGGGPTFDVQLGAVSDDDTPGFMGLRSLILPLGIYFVSWGGSVGIPDTTPAPEDPPVYGQWQISWDNSVAGLAQTASTTAVVTLNADEGIVGSLYRATASMVAAITDAEDALSIQVTSPYGGIASSLAAYLAITKIGSAA